MVLAKIFPVVLMILIGLSCRKFRILKAEGVDGLKTLATSFMLPVLLFNALATTEYTSRTLVIIGVMFLQLCIAFGLGLLIRKLIPSMGAFLPFIVSSFEGGMLGYPLYMVLCGEELISNIATLDISNTIFTFTIFLAFLTSTVSGSFKVKDMVSNVLHSPVFWGVFLGIVAGATGFMSWFLSTPVGPIYQSGEEMLTSAVSAIILIVVGYGLSFKKNVLVKCGKAIIARAAIAGILLCMTMFLLKNVLTTTEMKMALILYSFLPPTFVVPTFARNEGDSEFLSTTISMYSVLTIVVFIVLSFAG